MKNLLFYAGMALAYVLTSCNPDDEVKKSDNKAAEAILGIVMPNSNLQNAENIILLSDGRVVSPISGIQDFNRIKVGSKFQLTFTEAGKHNGVIGVNVSKIEEAQSSVFKAQAQTTADLESFFAGTFSGSFVRVHADSSVQDMIGSTQVTFDNSNYICTASDNGYPLGGSGTFVAADNSITFTDTNTWPAETDFALVLKGEFSYSVYEKSVFLWAAKDGFFYTYSLIK